MKHTLTLMALSLSAAGAMAQMSPVGTWHTFDEKTKEVKSEIVVSETNGVVSGRISKLLRKEAKQDAVCDQCTDERKDKPVLGMTIIRNIKASADDKGIWDGGDILDPNNGKVYKARLKPVDGGKKLEMRGYIGPFYRTQVWHRVE